MKLNKITRRIILVAVVIAIIVIIAILPKNKGSMSGGNGRMPGGNMQGGDAAETVYSVTTQIRIRSQAKGGDLTTAQSPHCGLCAYFLSTVFDTSFGRLTLTKTSIT